MLRSYADITRRLGDPLWWDDNGAPRYDPFTPEMLGVYDNYVAYMEIACQACGKLFRVGVGLGSVDWSRRAGWTAPDFPQQDTCGSFYYGDPPSHIDARYGDRCAGETMGSVYRRTLEFWRCDNQMAEWTRDAFYESKECTAG